MMQRIDWRTLDCFLSAPLLIDEEYVELCTLVTDDAIESSSLYMVYSFSAVSSFPFSNVDCAIF